MIGGSGYDPEVWGTARNRFFEAEQLPNVFGVTTAFPAVTMGIAMAAEQAGMEKVGAADMAEVTSTKQATQLFQAMSPLVGLDFVGGVTVSAAQPDFTAECLRFNDEGATFIQLTGPFARRMVGDCRSQGFSGYFGVSASAVNPDLYKNIGDSKLAGVLTSFPWFVDTPPVQRYRDVLEEHGAPEDLIGSPTSTATWATMELFREALTSSPDLGDTVERTEVLDAYFSIEDEDLDGLLPAPVTYTQGEPAPAPQCFWLFTYENGQFGGGDTPTCPGPEFDSVRG